MKRVSKEGRFNGNRGLFRNLRKVERQRKGEEEESGDRKKRCLDRKKTSGEKKRGYDDDGNETK